MDLGLGVRALQAADSVDEVKCGSVDFEVKPSVRAA